MKVMENDLSKVRRRGLRTLCTLHLRRFGDRGGDRRFHRLRHVDTFLGESIESTGKQNIKSGTFDSSTLWWTNIAMENHHF